MYEKKHKMHKSVKKCIFYILFKLRFGILWKYENHSNINSTKKKKNHCNLKFAVKNILCEKFQMLLVFKYFSI